MINQFEKRRKNMSNCVYKITNNINGKSYIGSTNNY